jgi:hypothetical protein
MSDTSEPASGAREPLSRAVLLWALGGLSAVVVALVVGGVGLYNLGSQQRGTSAENLRNERRTAYAEYVRQLVRVDTDILDESAYLAVFDGRPGTSANELFALLKRRKDSLDAAVRDFAAAAATVEMLDDEDVDACRLHVEVAVTGREVVLSHEYAKVEVLAARASVGTPAPGKIKIDARLRPPGLSAWNVLAEVRQDDFVRTAKAELNGGDSLAASKVCQAAQ